MRSPAITCESLDRFLLGELGEATAAAFCAHAAKCVDCSLTITRRATDTGLLLDVNRAPLSFGSTIFRAPWVCTRCGLLRETIPSWTSSDPAEIRVAMAQHLATCPGEDDKEQARSAERRHHLGQLLSALDHARSSVRLGEVAAAVPALLIACRALAEIIGPIGLVDAVRELWRQQLATASGEERRAIVDELLALLEEVRP